MHPECPICYYHIFSITYKIKLDNDGMCNGAVFDYINIVVFCRNRGSHDVMLFPSIRSTMDAVAAA